MSSSNSSPGSQDSHNSGDSNGSNGSKGSAGSKGSNGSKGSVADRPRNTTQASNLPPEAIAFATRMYDSARAGDVQIFEQALPRGLPANMTNEKGDSLVSCFFLSFLVDGVVVLFGWDWGVWREIGGQVETWTVEVRV